MSRNRPPAGEVARYAGRRLREERVARGLSLQDVQVRSEDRFLMPVTGSHERGARAVSIDRLAEYAEFYRLPMSAFLPDEAPLLVTRTFTAITAAKDAQLGRMAEQYEAEIAELNDVIAGLLARLKEGEAA